MTDDTTNPASGGTASNEPEPTFVIPEGGAAPAAPIVPPPRPSEPAPFATRSNMPPPVAPPPQPAAVAPAVRSQPPTPPAEPAQPFQPAVPQNDAGKKMPEEITRILKDVKLPERRDVAGGARPPEKEPIVFDTALGASVPKRVEPSVNIPPAQTPAAPQSNPEPQGGGAPHGEAAQAPVSAPGSIPRLHTLKDDLQGVVRDKKISLVRAVALEQEKKQAQGTIAQHESPEQKRHSRRMLGIVLAVVLLVLLGGVALFGAYTIMQARPGGAQAPAAPSLFFAESTVPFPIASLSDVDLKRTLAQLREASRGTLGSIMRIEPTVSRTTNGAAQEEPATIQEFLQAIGAHAPDDLVRTFTGDFFLGIHTLDKNSPILVIPISSYERAFAGMLAWEPSMSDDLSPLFVRVPPQMIDENGLLVERKFADAIISNYDARVLKDDSGAIDLVYTFPSRTMLIIAESTNSLSEILSRLRANRQL